MAVAAKWRHLPKKCLLWLLVCAVWSCASADVRKQKTKELVQSVICEVAPTWTAQKVSPDAEKGEQRNPMLDGRGKVIAVVLTSASSHHSLEQAGKLEALESDFHSNKMPDVKFILVNSAQSKHRLTDLLSMNLTMAIFQENAHEPVWTKLGGKKDYLFVYDRCGQLTFKIPFPLSIIHPERELVESSVTQTYHDNICGDQNCNATDTNQDVQASFEDVKEDNTEDATPDGSKPKESEDLWDEKLEQLFKSRKEGKIYRQETPTTTEPPLLNGLRSLYRNIMKHMPWASKDKKDDRYINSVRKFFDQDKVEENTVLSKVPEESMCNITQNSICTAWSKKKLDHARICCNLHTNNRSAQYLQKHCKHYTERRCKKVEHIMRCCHNDANNGSSADEQVNTRASVSSHPKS